jgi:SAM-dependent methyltransferase
MSPLNRKARRAAAKRGKNQAAKILAGSKGASVSDLVFEARERHRLGHDAQAQNICHQVLSHQPTNAEALNILGVIAQSSNQHASAIRFFAKAIARHENDATGHFNIAISYQALGQQDKAAEHFRQAIALGMTDRDVIGHISQNPIIGAGLSRLARQWPLPVQSEELFGRGQLDTIAKDAFFRSALVSIPLVGRELEAFQTQLRAELLRLAAANTHASQLVGDCTDECFCALAQQCFINEYVFTQSGEETQVANQLRAIVESRILIRDKLPAFMLAAIAAYFPLLSVAGAESLLQMEWSGGAAELLRQQIIEPLEEARDHNSIPVLSAIEDAVSVQVMHQYEEHPYPRWILNPLKLLANGEENSLEPDVNSSRPVKDILIAGCGTGSHVFSITRSFPDAHVLAIDMSLASLAYARRKTREEGLLNIEYAQADILNLNKISRSFDRVEVVGVLHHLGDPKAGWRVLLDLLRPGGEMRIGLYSEVARRAVVEARTFITERGYRATTEDIRTCRQELLRGGWPRWSDLTGTSDFYTTSGCRDLLFNVMEHRFTIPEIKAFLREQNVCFLGFELGRKTAVLFQETYPGVALNDLDHWHLFETANPRTFLQMYIFSIRKHSTPVARTAHRSSSASTRTSIPDRLIMDV